MPEKIFVHTPEGCFHAGDTVIDRTAEENNWPDVEGTIEEVDGSQVMVRYISGQVRWKMHVNLRLKSQEAEQDRLSKLRQKYSI